MPLPFSDLHIALALTPVAGVFAVRELWSRKRSMADLKEAEARAQQAREAATRAMQHAIEATESAKRTKEEFLARMSHELRTPLNAVIGFSRVLEKNRAGNQRPEDIAMLQRVRAGGEQLLRLIEDVLDQAHIERGQLALEVDDVNVADVVHRAVARFSEIASRKGLRIDAVLPTNAHSVSLDGKRFEKVIDHLIDNAIKFTNKGHISVVLIADGSGRPTQLDIVDTGVGIRADRLERLFKPFEQGDNSPHRPVGGAGLGLPIAKQLCHAMRCSLSVESAEGRGSRFSIGFP